MNSPLLDASSRPDSNSGETSSVTIQDDNRDKLRDMLAASSNSKRVDVDTSAKEVPAKGSFWNRNSTMINFWLDIVLAVLFIVQGWMFAVVHVVFPRGAGSEWKIWGATRLDWSESLFAVFCVFSALVVLHVMFHWAWVCGVVSTRLLGIKAKKDDGSQTLIGVIVLVALIHVIIVGILATRLGLVHSI